MHMVRKWRLVSISCIPELPINYYCIPARCVSVTLLTRPFLSFCVGGAYENILSREVGGGGGRTFDVALAIFVIHISLIEVSQLAINLFI